MNIDERLEKLGERHESLAQAVGLLTLQIDRVDKQLSELGKFTNEIALGTARLLSIVESHESRITRVEGSL